MEARKWGMVCSTMSMKAVLKLVEFAVSLVWCIFTHHKRCAFVCCHSTNVILLLDWWAIL